MSSKYNYLFPFEKIKYGSKVLIYGAGDVGQEFLQQMLLTHYAEVVGFVDRAYEQYPAMVVPVYAPEQIGALEFDFVILAMKTENYVKEITEQLIKKEIATEKILYAGDRGGCPNVLVMQNPTDSIELEELAYNKAPISVALKYGPGLGDCIIKKKLFEEIVKLAPACQIDIYAPNGSQYIPSIYSDQPNLNKVVDDGGALYAKNKNYYALAMKVFFVIEIDKVQSDILAKENATFYQKIVILQQKCIKYALMPFPIRNNKLHFDRMIYQSKNYFTSFSYEGIFDIKDQHVKIPLNVSWKKKFFDLKLTKYITLNYGNGSSKEEYVTKQWPYEYFCQFVELFKKQYPLIKIVQVGTMSARRVLGSDCYVLGANLELVKYVLKQAIVHLDIEGGLVHLATQLDTKCIVLFGPTQEPFFGYKDNINIVSEKCKGCSYLYDDIYQCARGLDKPECMYSITPKIVMKRVTEYMKMIELKEEKI